MLFKILLYLLLILNKKKLFCILSNFKKNILSRFLMLKNIIISKILSGILILKFSLNKSNNMHYLFHLDCNTFTIFV